MGITIIEVGQLSPELTNKITSVVDEYSNWGEQTQPPEPPPGLRRWVINNNTPVGDLSAHPIGYGPNEGSTVMNIGVKINPVHSQQGFGSASQQLLAGLLHREGFVRVEASTDVTNIFEQRALAKAGFAFEGTLRSAQLRASGRHDLQVWSHIS